MGLCEQQVCYVVHRLKIYRKEGSSMFCLYKLCIKNMKRESTSRMLFKANVQNYDLPLPLHPSVCPSHPSACDYVKHIIFNKIVS